MSIDKNATKVAGVIQDLFRPRKNLNDSELAGIRFFNEVIDNYIPRVRTLFFSFNIDSGEDAFLSHPSIQRIRFLRKTADSQELCEAVEWLLQPISDGEYADSSFPSPISDSLEDLCRYIYRNPNFLHSMPPRTLEELISEMYREYGWQVDLTLATKDGGYDILAVRHTGLLAARVLIEVKRYAPNRPVSVGIVRALYGIRLRNTASQVVLATSSHVSRDAKAEFAQVVPWELDFLERNRILEWCRTRGGIALNGQWAAPEGDLSV